MKGTPSLTPNEPKKHGLYYLATNFLKFGDTKAVILPTFAANHIASIWTVFDPTYLLVIPIYPTPLRKLSHLIEIIWPLMRQRLDLPCKTQRHLQYELTEKLSPDDCKYLSKKMSRYIVQQYYFQGGIPRRLYHLWEGLHSGYDTKDLLCEHLKNKLNNYNKAVQQYYDELSGDRKTYLLLIGALGVSATPDSQVFPQHMDDPTTFNQMQEEGRLFPFKVEEGDSTEDKHLWYFIPPGLLYPLKVC